MTVNRAAAPPTCQAVYNCLCKQGGDRLLELSSVKKVVSLHAYLNKQLPASRNITMCSVPIALA